MEQRHHDIAATMQARLEEVYFGLLRELHKQSKQKAVCLAGGVAFNCVANGKIFSETPFEKVYVQPAAGDAGLAVGAAFYVEHQILGQPRQFVMEHAYWGPGYSPRADAWRADTKRHGGFGLRTARNGRRSRLPRKPRG